MNNQDQFVTIVLPVHPDDAAIPMSLINLPLPSGRIVTLQAPLAPKSLEMLYATLMACKDALLAPDSDFQI